METELDILRDITQKLEAAGIPYMLTGSMAMSHYALPRMTRDIDLVIELRSADAPRLVALLSGDYYVSEEAAVDAARRRSMFNAIHFRSSIKVDLIILPDSAFAREEFGRRRVRRLADINVTIVSREDLILSKLVWAKDSHSELQLRDVRNLLTADRAACDLDYLRQWASRLDVREMLDAQLKRDE